MAFFQCRSRPHSDFSPLFRLLDDYETHRSEPRPTRARAVATPSFTPSFDVREASNGYYLDGELPGVDQSNIEIEFSDPQTLIVKGRTERNYQQTQSQDQGQEQTSSPSPSPSPRQLQATVEDDSDEADSDFNTDDDTSSQQLKQKLYAETTKQQTQTQTQTQTQKTQPEFHFWASERSIGEFQRTFSFPTRVDQDGVRANLKNGILSVYVPKEAAPKMKKIRIL
ncbi:30 kDa heat shock protein [Penicillium waksmanii]|uniref:30 kDa heat shock protein n=1 Tax=Penicillium waksmanii TaxID=69791 RepID=UPI0025497A52|nr:30 kDa heat shock protein [Penicillium waksmanii]KAJ5973996.1 30 kDa heat shock protein [Penicillium waksmanii]